ncbi:MAG: GyrI-like domain-containing protein [Alphaproteobacteria bacterium]|nr:GyrI-like domain-containing protein [Alphaproteobacteria bacterium]
MEPRIIERGDIRAVGLRGEFDQETGSEIPELWRTFWPQADGIPDRVPGVALGVIEMLDKETGRFAYTAACEVTEIGAIPEGLSATTLAGGRFAVFTRKLSSPDIHAELSQAFQYIHGTWMAQNRDRLRGYYELEVYDDRFDPQELSGEIDIYVPIR